MVDDELLEDIKHLNDKAGKIILLLLAQFLLKGDDKPLETLRILIEIYKQLGM